MPAKKSLTPRQERVLKKIGLMPLTPATKIAERFGIPIYKIHSRVTHQNWSDLRLRHALVKRFSANPELRGLLAHPKLWVYPLIEEWAGTHTASEISRELSLRAKGQKIPSTTMINHYIRLNGLRTPEQLRRVKTKHRPKRVENNLNSETRAKLSEWAYEFFTNRIIRRGKNYSAEEMREWMLDYALEDTRYIKISPDFSPARMKSTWFAYLAKAARFYQLNAFNRIVKRRVRAYTASELIGDMAVKSKPKEESLRDVSFLTPLTRRQREYFELAIKNKSVAEIAQELEITLQAVNQLKQSVRKKIRPRKE